ncbi:metallophosphoesterase [Paenibacillus sp. NFR01]|uniref:metallophosphoesterase n=1 Tax=Paenibacillus sp. NFR01 TaxID=1566279 RepID=UPI0008C0B288|nr:metallophosphoesterase [Paenibacillus sp. NFR01]SET60116.1 Calcineurin-like phosphoesterase [Paenibacillus sp. NFR01]
MKKPLSIFLSLILLLPLSSCTRSGHGGNAEYRIQSGHALTLFAATDTHYLAPELTDSGPAFQRFVEDGDGKELGYSDALLSAFGYEVAVKRPDILILSGDLTNNGEKASHLGLAEHLRQIEAEAGTKVYVIPGNHDINNPWARKFAGQKQVKVKPVSPKQFRSIYGEFGYDEAISRDPASLSYLAAPSDDLWLLMLDTSQYADNAKLGSPQLDGQLGPETLAWIAECGTKARDNGAQLLAVMHHSLLNHSEFIRKGFTLNNNEQAGRVLMSIGVPAVLSGHIHIQDIASYSENGRTVYDIADSALSVYPQQYGVLQYEPAARKLVYGTERLNVELWAKASGSSDPNLLNFKQYSADSFTSLSADRTYSRLKEDAAYSRYSDAQLKAMAEAVGALNAIYFAGTADTDMAAVTASEGFRLWQEAPPGGMRSYALGMAARERKDNRHLEIVLP